jgi:hypothetical protein
VREDERLLGGGGWQENVYNTEEWKKLLRMARNCHIVRMAVGWHRIGYNRTEYNTIQYNTVEQNRIRHDNVSHRQTGLTVQAKVRLQQ